MAFPIPPDAPVMSTFRSVKIPPIVRCIVYLISVGNAPVWQPTGGSYVCSTMHGCPVDRYCSQRSSSLGQRRRPNEGGVPEAGPSPAATLP